MNLDETIFKLINGYAFKYSLLDNTMIIFSKYVPYIFMSLIVLIYLYGVYQKNKEIRYVAVSVLCLAAINIFLSFIIGLIYFRPRPFVTQKVKLLFPHIPDASFPSDHAIGTMSIALGINRYNNKFGRDLIILSIIVGISRIYVGHHYPSDVIGGFAIAIITNLLFGKYIEPRLRTCYYWVEAAVIKRCVKL